MTRWRATGGHVRMRVQESSPREATTKLRITRRTQPWASIVMIDWGRLFQMKAAISSKSLRWE